MAIAPATAAPKETPAVSKAKPEASKPEAKAAAAEPLQPQEATEAPVAGKALDEILERAAKAAKAVAKAVAKPFVSIGKKFMETRGTGLLGVLSRMAVRTTRLGIRTTKATARTVNKVGNAVAERKAAAPGVRESAPKSTLGSRTIRAAFQRAATPGQAQPKPAMAAAPAAPRAATTQRAKLG